MFTSEYNHIVGSNALAAPFATGLATSKSIEPGTTFINDYVNKQGAVGYKDTTITLGNFANGVSLSDGLPVQTNSTGGLQTLIAGNSLKLNGTNLPALTLAAGATLSAAQVAAWANTIKGSTGVTAEADNTMTYTYDQFDITKKLSINGTTIVNAGVPATVGDLAALINANTGATGVEAAVNPNGTILIQNILSNKGNNIVLGNPTVGQTTNFLNETNGAKVGRVKYSGTSVNFEFQNHGAGQGKATDLSRIGLATTITSSSRLDDDFLVYVTGSTKDVSIRYDIQEKPTLPDVSIEPPFSLTFLSPTQVQVTDTNTDTVLAKQSYAWPDGVLVNDVKVVFEEAPTTGDVFTIKANEGAIADNGNITRILAVQEVGVNGNEIPTQRYISLISDVSNQHNLAEMSSQALQVVKDDAEALLDKSVGVTLDTEAADLIRYQQSYQAAAQIIKVSQDIFDFLITASR